MSDPFPLLCIGHSHVGALQEAATQDGVALHAINFWEQPFALTRLGDTAWQLGDTLIPVIHDHPGPVFSLVGGASYGVMGMLMHPRRWDVVLPALPSLPVAADAEVLPYGAVRDSLRALMEEYLDITRQIREVAGPRVVQIEPPPPYADAERIRPFIYPALYPGMTLEISPAPLRYKLWRMQSDLLREHCDEHAIDFVASPPEAADAAGYMRPEFFLDGAHANAAYGRLVLRQMQERSHATSL